MYSSSNSSSFLHDDDGRPHREHTSDDSPSSTGPVGCWAGARARAMTDIPKKVSQVVKDELVTLTNLTPAVIELLYSRFRLLAKSGFMSYNCFKRSMGMMALLDETFLPERLFAAFDVREDGVLDFVEWCASLGIMMKGSEDERLEFSFRLLRPPGKGKLRKGNSLKGPMWRGVQSSQQQQQQSNGVSQSRRAVWNAVYSHSSANRQKQPPPAASTEEGVSPQVVVVGAAAAAEDHQSTMNCFGSIPNLLLEPPANCAMPRKGSRNWVTYLLATDPADPNNVITLPDFIHIVRSLENTRSQLTTDLCLGTLPESVIQDVFCRACQLAPPNYNSNPNVLPSELTLENYKLAVTHMPEFLELLGIPTWSNAGNATSPDDSMMYKTPKSTRRMLSDPGRDTNDLNNQSMDILNTVKTDLLKLVRLMNQAGTEHLSFQSMIPCKPLLKSQSLAVSQSVHASHKSASRMSASRISSSPDASDDNVLTTPMESHRPIFDRVALHSAPRPDLECSQLCGNNATRAQRLDIYNLTTNSNRCSLLRCKPLVSPINVCAVRESPDDLPELLLLESSARLRKVQYPSNSPVLISPSGQGVRRIAQASDPRLHCPSHHIRDGGRQLRNRKSVLRIGHDTMKFSSQEPSLLSSQNSSLSELHHMTSHARPPPDNLARPPIGSLPADGLSTPSEGCDDLPSGDEELAPPKRVIVRSKLSHDASNSQLGSMQAHSISSVTSGSMTPEVVNLLSRSEEIEVQGMSNEEVRNMAFKLIDWIENVTGETVANHRERRERMFVNATNFSVLKKNDLAQARGKLPRHRPRRRRVETKILDVSARKGLVVHFGHRSWNLVLNMMLGIRMAAYRCQTSETSLQNTEHKIDSYDFLIKENFCVLPRVANIIDKIKKYDYEIVRFIDYAPMVFKKLRDLDQLNAADYLDSVGPEKLLNNIVLGNLSSLSELYTEGKSGAIFYYSNDGRFIVKTIDRSAAKLFKQRILSSYYEHLSTHRNSLVIRIYGFHALKIQLGDGMAGRRRSNGKTGVMLSRKARVKKLYFIVMKNIFHTNCIIHRRYDLKGSWIGRTTFNTTDMIPYKVKYAHATPCPQSLNEERDVLQSSKIWQPKTPTNDHVVCPENNDESCGSFNPPPPPPEWWDATISLKDLDILNLGDYVCLEAKKRDEILTILEADSLWLSKLHLIDYSLLVGIHVNGIDDNYVIPPQVPIRHVAPSDHHSELYTNAIMSKDKKCQYFFGVVDILTTYNNAKRFEHICKSITNDHNGISCIKPVKYQDRFQKFMNTVFL